MTTIESIMGPENTLESPIIGTKIGETIYKYILQVRKVVSEEVNEGLYTFEQSVKTGQKDVNGKDITTKQPVFNHSEFETIDELLASLEKKEKEKKEKAERKKNNIPEPVIEKENIKKYSVISSDVKNIMQFILRAIIHEADIAKPQYSDEYCSNVITYIAKEKGDGNYLSGFVYSFAGNNVIKQFIPENYNLDKFLGEKIGKIAGLDSMAVATITKHYVEFVKVVAYYMAMSIWERRTSVDIKMLMGVLRSMYVNVDAPEYAPNEEIWTLARNYYIDLANKKENKEVKEIKEVKKPIDKDVPKPVSETVTPPTTTPKPTGRGGRGRKAKSITATPTVSDVDYSV